MVTLSKPISASQAQAYHKEEFANARDNYYSEGECVRGEWQGKLAERYGLHGEVNEQRFARLSEGQHPETGEQLVRHQTAREYVNAQGAMVSTMEHRAGWDATFSAPKSVSLTALVGGDDCVKEAHRESVRVALDEMENTHRRGSAAMLRHRQRVNGSWRSSSTTAAVRSTATPHRSCTRTRSSSILPKPPMGTRERCSRRNCIKTSSM
jgi:conjugative relaxase-like TrwC/TraI family protein